MLTIKDSRLFSGVIHNVRLNLIMEGLIKVQLLSIMCDTDSKLFSGSIWVFYRENSNIKS